MLVEYVEELTRVVLVEIPDDYIGCFPEDLESSEVRTKIFEHVATNGWDDEYIQESSTNPITRR